MAFNPIQMAREGRWSEVIDQYLAEGRSVSGGKGDSTAKGAEDLSLENEKNQISFNQSLQNIFQNQYADQKDVLDYIKGKMQPMIENPTGYSPEALAAMRTSASDTNATQFNNAEQALQAKQFARGGRDLPSGVDAQTDAQLAAAGAAQEAGTQNAITQSDADLKQKNYWNALNVLGGNAATMAPQSYAGEANGAAGAASGAADSVATDANAYANSKKGFFTTLAGSFAQGLGGGLGSFLGGGAGIAPGKH